MDEIGMLSGLLGSRTGPCPDCADERLLLPVDEVGWEWACADCGAAFTSWHGALSHEDTAPRVA